MAYLGSVKPGAGEPISPRAGELTPLQASSYTPGFVQTQTPSSYEGRIRPRFVHTCIALFYFVFICVILPIYLILLYLIVAYTMYRFSRDPLPTPIT